MEGTLRVSYSVPFGKDEVRLKPIKHPTDRETLEAVLRDAGVGSFQGRVFYIDDVETDVPGLSTTITDFVDIDEMNYLAVKLRTMNGAEHEVLAAAIEAKRHCQNPAQLINLIENIYTGCFEILPVHDAADYGAYLLSIHRDRHACAGICGA